MNNELRKNAEGYTDPTAAATLRRKEPGDVWTYRDGECLIIKDHNGFANILRLHDNNLYGDRVKVTDRPDGPRYVDPAFIISGRYREMGQYVETLDASVFVDVVHALEDSMGVNLQTRAVQNTPDSPAMGLLDELENLRKLLDLQQAEMENMGQLHKAEVEDYEKTAENLQKGLYTAKTLQAAAEGDARKAWNQLELLREMYNDLLAKVVGGGVVTDGQA